MVDKQAMSLVELRMRTYGETEEMAKEKLAMVQAERAAALQRRVNSVRMPVPETDVTSGVVANV
jgi:hypothetical protein